MRGFKLFNLFKRPVRTMRVYRVCRFMIHIATLLSINGFQLFLIRSGVTMVDVNGVSVWSLRVIRMFCYNVVAGSSRGAPRPPGHIHRGPRVERRMARGPARLR